MSGHPLRIGTRGSRLALAQASRVRDALLAQHPNLDIQINVIATQGDIDHTHTLTELGGKGVFVKTIESALVNDEIDIAVHSLKDMTSAQDTRLELSGFLHAESVCDVIVFREFSALELLPQGARIATGSNRRRAQLFQVRPDLMFCDVRGNVDTRLQKLQSGDWDALVMSEVGLIRLGVSVPRIQRLDPTTFVPAPGQGVIALQTRKIDASTRTLCQVVSDTQQAKVSLFEQSVLELVGFDCRLPLGLYSRMEKASFSVTAHLSDMQYRPLIYHTWTVPEDERGGLVATVADALRQWVPNAP